MPGYWWQCTECNKPASFPDVNADQGIVTFIWDSLRQSGWDQTLLLRDCPSCGRHLMRITYKFPREKDPEVIRVLHIVGLPCNDDGYLPMMWQTQRIKPPKEEWFDFKYMNGRNNWGLNKAAVFTRADFKRLLELFREHTGQQFP